MSSGNRRATRANRYLEKIGSKLGLTKEGREWLIMAIDPFNDQLDTCSGFPDGSGAKCIVEPIKETFTINCPTGVTTNWDCHIVNLPWLLPVAFGNASSQYTTDYYGTDANLANVLINSWNIEGNAANQNLGGLAVMAAASTNNNWNPNTTWGLGSAYSQNLVYPSPVVASGNYRVIGMAFEVCNTTADLYKQGSCTIYRTPVPSLQDANAGTLWTANSTSPTAPATVLNMDSWPVTSQAAFLAIDSIQHAAADGCYVVSTLNTTDLPYIKFNSIQPFVVFGQTNANPPQESQMINLLPILHTATNPGVATAVGTSGVQWTRTHMGGALFTGLSPSTTLQVNVKWLIEKFPSQNDQILAPICHTSPDRDNIAMEMYSHLADNMPVGCKFDDNGFGDWISDALSTVTDYVAPVLSAMPHPMAQAIGGGLMAAKHIKNNPVKMSTPHPSQGNIANVLATVKKETKAAKNSATRAKNEEIRARNEVIRAKKAAKHK